MTTRAPDLSRRRDPAAVCPACAAPGLDVFYTLPRVPAQSCLLTPTRDQALAFPLADLRLAFCPACGFITNTAFDERSQELSARYEETQGFSPTFGSYARTIAQRYADRYPLRDRLTLEIGCGKGEFLALLCETSGGRGLGVDPTFIPGRLRSTAAERLEFRTERFSASHLTGDPAFVVCRHTLEHIPQVRSFIGALRDALGTRRDVALSFEVPDILRILREGAFWDLYNEHCSLFSPGSLARLFRAARFDVTDLVLEYVGQYIVLDAAPAPAPTTPRLALEDDLGELTRLIGAFGPACAASIARWRALIDDGAARALRTVVWAASSKAVGFLSTLNITDELVPFAVDINPHKHGTYLPGTGQRVVPPAFMKDHRPDRVILMNPIYTREVREQLRAMGVEPEILAV